MSSSQLPSHSPGREVYQAAEEYHFCYAQGSSEASSIVTATSDENVYAAANQKPTASPDIDRGIVPSISSVAQNHDPSESLRSIEENPVECSERSSTNATIASRGPRITYLAEAGTNHGQQGEYIMQHSELRELEKEEDIAGKPAFLTIVSAKHRPTSLPESFLNKELVSGFDRHWFNWKRLFNSPSQDWFKIYLGNELVATKTMYGSRFLHCKQTFLCCKYGQQLKSGNMQRHFTSRASRLCPEISH